jgi:hypothetical protein
MRSFKFLVIALAILGTAGMAAAELQNVEVGGSIRITGNWYDFDDAVIVGAGQPLTYGTVRNRPNPGGVWPLSRIFSGDFLRPGASIGETSFFEQRTRLSVKADFTDDVTAFIELDSYDVWGEDFRSDYITGVDGRGGDNVDLYQAYIEANEMWGTPLRLRIGRQEVMLGSEFLVGNNDTASFYQGLSFDGIRLTYATDMFSVDGMWFKLAEGPIGEDAFDNDINMYGIYGSYTGLEDVTIDAYWMYVRDDVDTRDGFAAGAAPYFTGNGNPGPWWFRNPVFNSYVEKSDLHTIGLRGAGEIGAFDFESEIAFQFGDVTVNNPRFFGPFNIFPSDDEIDFGEFAANLEVGYTFDASWTPRIFLGFAYFGGDDDGGAPSWGETIFGNYPYGSNLAFNRLFSDWEYSEFLANTDMSNIWIARGGVGVMPTESVSLDLVIAYFNAVDDTHIDHRTVAGAPFWTFFQPWRFSTSDDSIGWEVGLYASYEYTEDLTFSAGYAHFFTGDGVEDGNYIVNNGLGFLGSRDSDDDWDYLFFSTEISF